MYTHTPPPHNVQFFTFLHIPHILSPAVIYTDTVPSCSSTILSVTSACTTTGEVTSPGMGVVSGAAITVVLLLISIEI